jgi:hypothetical protein
MVMRLHRATGAPVLDCRDFLASLSVGEREKAVQEYEQGKRGYCVSIAGPQEPAGH